MKLGVFTVLFGQRPFSEALDYIVRNGVEAVEIGCGAYPGKAHCDPDILLKDPAALRQFRQEIESRNLTISALSCHGNPLNPNQAEAERHIGEFKQAVRLAAELGVERVITFSGCPGDSPTATYPNWVTCAWPPEYQKIVEWQWNEVAIPYWQQEVAWCKTQGIHKIALEAHPGFLVYNVETAQRLRSAVGPEIGVNFDPSHLWWQGIDPVLAIRELGDAIFHFHAKDTKLDAVNFPLNGGLDYKPYRQEIKRSWVFRSVGYGHGVEVWRDIVSNLRLVGYDWVMSIEHEDSLMSVDEGFRAAVSSLKSAIIAENPTAMWWA